MNLAFAIDRLIGAGWCPSADTELETHPDGRVYPSVPAVRREFARAGLELSIKQHLMYRCYRATWAPAGEPPDASHASDDRHGTVVGACDREAAVYALAQLCGQLAAV